MPVLSLDMMAKLSEKAAGKLPTGSDRPSGNVAVTLDSFPKLHNVHIRHRIPHATPPPPAPSTEEPSTTATPAPLTSTLWPRLDEDEDTDTLEVLEEIDYMTRPSNDLLLDDSAAPESVPESVVPTAPQVHHDLRPFHHVRRHRDRFGVVSVPEFRPIQKRVVMSRRNLMETLQEMIARQEQSLEIERSLISSELLDD
jgi:hypothetical protein